jgi:hypothetical protein
MAVLLLLYIMYDSVYLVGNSFQIYRWEGSLGRFLEKGFPKLGTDAWLCYLRRRNDLQ